MAEYNSKTFGKRRTKLELQNFKLTENPPFFIHAVSGWAFHKTKNMPYIDDLSFSNIVNIIQGEEIKGADVLNSIAHEMEENNKIIEKLENDLVCAKGRKDTLIEGSKRVLQHLKKEAPLAVQRQGYIVVLTKENISIERNVL